MVRPARGAVAVLCCAALLGGCTQSSSAGSRVAGDVAQQGYVSGDGSTTIVAATERVAAPALAGQTLSGSSFDLADLRDRVVVLNVWASWCAPCRAEAATLQQAAEETEQDGVTFVGLNTRDTRAAAQAFVRRFGLTYDSVVDADGRLLLALRDSLPPAAIPSTLVLDRQGRVAARAIGEVDRSRLLGLIEPILAEGPRGSG